MSFKASKTYNINYKLLEEKQMQLLPAYRNLCKTAGICYLTVLRNLGMINFSLFSFKLFLSHLSLHSENVG